MCVIWRSTSHAAVQKKKFNRAHFVPFTLSSLTDSRELKLNEKLESTSRRAHSRAWLARRLSPRNENVKKKKWNKEFQNEIYNITIGPELRLRNVELCSTMFTTRTYADDCVVSLFFSFPFYTNISRRPSALSALSTRKILRSTFQFHTYFFFSFLNIIAWIFLVATAEQLELNIDFDFLVCSASFPLFFIFSFLVVSLFSVFFESEWEREKSFARGGKWKLNKQAAAEPKAQSWDHGIQHWST